MPPACPAAPFAAFLRADPVARQDPGGFTRVALEDGAVLFTVRPARPAAAFLAATGLLGGLFGLPALAVLIGPRRNDPLSLAAALCALAVLGVAVVAFRRARRGRAPRAIRADPEGLALPEQRLAWNEVLALRVEHPEAPRNAGGGIHGLAAAVAAQQRAAEARVVLDHAAGGPPLLVAGGLGAPVANALRDALWAMRRG